MGAWGLPHRTYQNLQTRSRFNPSGDGGFWSIPDGFSQQLVKLRHDVTLYSAQRHLKNLQRTAIAGECRFGKTDLHNPFLFQSLPEHLCGGHGEKVTKTEDIGLPLRRALAVNGPAIGLKS